MIEMRLALIEAFPADELETVYAARHGKRECVLVGVFIAGQQM